MLVQLQVHAWTINEPHLPEHEQSAYHKKAGLEVLESHPLYRMCFGQYRAGLISCAGVTGMSFQHTLANHDVLDIKYGGTAKRNMYPLLTSCFYQQYYKLVECLLPASFQWKNIVPLLQSSSITNGLVSSNSAQETAQLFSLAIMISTIPAELNSDGYLSIYAWKFHYQW